MPEEKNQRLKEYQENYRKANSEMLGKTKQKKRRK